MKHRAWILLLLGAASLLGVANRGLAQGGATNDAQALAAKLDEILQQQERITRRLQSAREQVFGQGGETSADPTLYQVHVRTGQEAQGAGAEAASALVQNFGAAGGTEVLRSIYADLSELLMEQQYFTEEMLRGRMSYSECINWQTRFQTKFDRIRKKLKNTPADRQLAEYIDQIAKKSAQTLEQLKNDRKTLEQNARLRGEQAALLAALSAQAMTASDRQRNVSETLSQMRQVGNPTTAQFDAAAQKQTRAGEALTQFRGKVEEAASQALISKADADRIHDSLDRARQDQQKCLENLRARNAEGADKSSHEASSRLAQAASDVRRALEKQAAEKPGEAMANLAQSISRLAERQLSQNEKTDALAKRAAAGKEPGGTLSKEAQELKGRQQALAREAEQIRVRVSVQAVKPGIDPAQGQRAVEAMTQGQASQGQAASALDKEQYAKAGEQGKIAAGKLQEAAQAAARASSPQGGKDAAARTLQDVGAHSAGLAKAQGALNAGMEHLAQKVAQEGENDAARQEARDLRARQQALGRETQDLKDQAKAASGQEGVDAKKAAAAVAALDKAAAAQAQAATALKKGQYDQAASPGHEAEARLGEAAQAAQQASSSGQKAGESAGAKAMKEAGEKSGALAQEQKALGEKMAALAKQAQKEGESEAVKKEAQDLKARQQELARKTQDLRDQVKAASGQEGADAEQAAAAMAALDKAVTAQTQTADALDKGEYGKAQSLGEKAEKQLGEAAKSAQQAAAAPAAPSPDTAAAAKAMQGVSDRSGAMAAEQDTLNKTMDTLAKHLAGEGRSDALDKQIRELKGAQEALSEAAQQLRNEAAQAARQPGLSTDEAQKALDALDKALAGQHDGAADLDRGDPGKAMAHGREASAQFGEAARHALDSIPEDKKAAAAAAGAAQAAAPLPDRIDPLKNDQDALNAQIKALAEAAGTGAMTEENRKKASDLKARQQALADRTAQLAKDAAGETSKDAPAALALKKASQAQAKAAARLGEGKPEEARAMGESASQSLDLAARSAREAGAAGEAQKTEPTVIDTAKTANTAAALADATRACALKQRDLDDRIESLAEKAAEAGLTDEDRKQLSAMTREQSELAAKTQMMAQMAARMSGSGLPDAARFNAVREPLEKAAAAQTASAQQLGQNGMAQALEQGRQAAGELDKALNQAQQLAGQPARPVPKGTLKDLLSTLDQGFDQIGQKAKEAGGSVQDEASDPVRQVVRQASELMDEQKRLNGELAAVKPPLSAPALENMARRQKELGARAEALKQALSSTPGVEPDEARAVEELLDRAVQSQMQAVESLRNGDAEAARNGAQASSKLIGQISDQLAPLAKKAGAVPATAGNRIADGVQKALRQQQNLADSVGQAAQNSAAAPALPALQQQQQQLAGQVQDLVKDIESQAAAQTIDSKNADAVVKALQQGVEEQKQSLEALAKGDTGSAKAQAAQAGKTMQSAGQTAQKMAASSQPSLQAGQKSPSGQPQGSQSSGSATGEQGTQPTGATSQPGQTGESGASGSQSSAGQQEAGQQGQSGQQQGSQGQQAQAGQQQGAAQAGASGEQGQQQQAGQASAQAQSGEKGVAGEQSSAGQQGQSGQQQGGQQQSQSGQQQQGSQGQQSQAGQQQGTAQAGASGEQGQQQQAGQASAQTQSGEKGVAGEQSSDGQQGQSGQQQGGQQSGASGEQGQQQAGQASAQAQSGEKGGAGEQSSAGQQGQSGQQQGGQQQSQSGQQQQGSQGQQSQAGQQQGSQQSGASGEQGQQQQAGQASAQAQSGEKGGAGEQSSAGQQGQSGQQQGGQGQQSQSGQQQGGQQSGASGEQGQQQQAGQAQAGQSQGEQTAPEQQGQQAAASQNPAQADGAAIVSQTGQALESEKEVRDDLQKIKQDGAAPVPSKVDQLESKQRDIEAMVGRLGDLLASKPEALPPDVAGIIRQELDKARQMAQQVQKNLDAQDIDGALKNAESAMRSLDNAMQLSQQAIRQPSGQQAQESGTAPPSAVQQIAQQVSQAAQAQDAINQEVDKARGDPTAAARLDLEALGKKQDSVSDDVARLRDLVDQAQQQGQIPPDQAGKLAAQLAQARKAAQKTADSFGNGTLPDQAGAQASESLHQASQEAQELSSSDMKNKKMPTLRVVRLKDTIVTSFDMEMDQQTVVKIRNEAHTVSVEPLDGGHVRVTVHSNPMTEVLTPGQTWDIDTNGDGMPDAQLVLDKVVGGKAYFHITERLGQKPAGGDAGLGTTGDEQAEQAAAPKDEDAGKKGWAQKRDNAAPFANTGKDLTLYNAPPSQAGGSGGEAEKPKDAQEDKPVYDRGTQRSKAEGLVGAQDLEDASKKLAEEKLREQAKQAESGGGAGGKTDEGGSGYDPSQYDPQTMREKKGFKNDGLLWGTTNVSYSLNSNKRKDIKDVMKLLEEEQTGSGSGSGPDARKPRKEEQTEGGERFFNHANPETGGGEGGGPGQEQSQGQGAGGGGGGGSDESGSGEQQPPALKDEMQQAIDAQRQLRGRVQQMATQAGAQAKGATQPKGAAEAAKQTPGSKAEASKDQQSSTAAGASAQQGAGNAAQENAAAASQQDAGQTQSGGGAQSAAGDQSGSQSGSQSGGQSSGAQSGSQSGGQSGSGSQGGGGDQSGGGADSASGASQQGQQGPAAPAGGAQPSQSGKMGKMQQLQGAQGGGKGGSQGGGGKGADGKGGAGNAPGDGAPLVRGSGPAGEVKKEKSFDEQLKEGYGPSDYDVDKTDGGGKQPEGSPEGGTGKKSGGEKGKVSVRGESKTIQLSADEVRGILQEQAHIRDAVEKMGAQLEREHVSLDGFNEARSTILQMIDDLQDDLKGVVDYEKIEDRQGRILSTMEKIKRRYTERPAIRMRIDPNLPPDVRDDVLGAMDEKYFPQYDKRIKRYYQSIAEHST